MIPILYTFGQELPKNETSNSHRTCVQCFEELLAVLIKSHPCKRGFIFSNGGWMERGEEGGFHPRI